MNGRLLFAWLTTCFLIGTLGCSGGLTEKAGDSFSEAPAGAADSVEPARRAMRGKIVARGEDASGVDLASMESQQPDRYLIKNASVTVEVDDARAATETLLKAVSDAGGYVANLQERTDSLKVRYVTLDVRVPAEHFDQSMLLFDSLGDVLDKNVTAQDVTEEYVDSEAKLRNLKRTEERILGHLERTANLEDTLKAEKELTRYREQIERVEGRLRFLQNRVDFSSIRVSLQERAKARGLAPGPAFSSGKEFSEAARSLLAFLRNLWVIAIWLGVWAVVWIPVLVIVLFVVHRQRKKQG